MINTVVLFKGNTDSNVDPSSQLGAGIPFPPLPNVSYLSVQTIAHEIDRYWVVVCEPPTT